jgi:uncharacterized membrane protein YhaH (DUF805 family)
MRVVTAWVPPENAICRTVRRPVAPMMASNEARCSGRSSCNAVIGCRAARRGHPIATPRLRLPQGRRVTEMPPESRLSAFAHLMFAYRGRIGRIYFWLGLMATSGIAGFIAAIVEGTFTGVGEIGRFLSVAVIAGLVVWMHSAVIVKRLHDRDHSGWWYLFYGIAPPFVFFSAIQLHSVGQLEAASILYVLSAVALVWVVVELGLMPGTPGKNRFGPEAA